MADLKKQMADLRLERQTKIDQAKALLGKDTVSETDEKLANELILDSKRITEDLRKKGELFDGLEAELKAMSEYTDTKSNGVVSNQSANVRGTLGTAQADVDWREKVAYASWGIKTADIPHLKSWDYAEAFGQFITGAEMSSETRSVLEKGFIGTVKNQPEYLFPLFFTKDLTVGTAASAGNLTYNQWIPNLVEKAAGPQDLYGMCTRIQTVAKAADMPRSTYSTDNTYTSGVRVSWVNEQPAPNVNYPDYGHKVTDPTFEQVSMTVGTVMMYIDLSENLLEDSAVGALDYCSRKFQEAYSLDRESKILLGSGTSGVPQGIITLAKSAETLKPTRVFSGTANSFTAAHVYALQDALPEQYENGAVWVGRKATRSIIRQFSQVNNQLFDNPMGDSIQTLLSSPYIRSGFMPLQDDATNKVPLIYGQMSGYTILERVGFGVRQNPYIRSSANTVRLEGRGRYTGKFLEPWRMAFLECTAT